MELKIYDKTGNLKLTVSPNASSTVTDEVMGECCVSASFTHTAFVPLDVNDRIEVSGVKYKIRSPYRPTQKNTQTYQYQVKFYAPIHDAEDALMLYTADGDIRSEFSYDGGPREHLQLWVDNMNRIAGGTLWSIGTVITGENKAVEYNNMSCWDAAFGSSGIAAVFETEMWADGFTVNLCKASRGETVELGYLQGLTQLSQEDNGEVKFFTRLFPLGSTRNIDASKYGHARLQLPSGAAYADKNTELYGVKEAYEEDAFSNIYPKYTGTIDSVRTEEKEDEEGRKYTVYYFKDSGMGFNPADYQIPDLTFMLAFQDGDLAGRGKGEDGSFEAAWHEDTSEWEIINVYPDETAQVPGGSIVPNVGDTYIPWNFSLPQEYITAAEQAYAEAVDDFLGTYSFDTKKYNGTTDRNYIERNRTSLILGQNVRLLSDKYFSTGYKDTRIVKCVRRLNDLSQATITCTDQIGTGWKASVDNRLGSLQYILTKQEQQTLIDIIRTGDNKTPSDYNVFSALKALAMFLRKDKPDSTKYLIKFLGGLISDNIESQDFASGPFGTGFVVKRDPKTGKSYIETDELYVRLKAYFETLEIKHLSHVGGRIVASPAGMECVKVELVSAEYESLYDSEGSLITDSEGEEVLVSTIGGEQAYRCYFKQTDGEREIVNEFAVDDLAQCREFNVKEGVSHEVSNQYYWRRVIGVGEDYIDLSITDCDTGSMEPKAGDTIVTIGNKTDTNRQHVVFLSSYDNDAPCIKLYSGINSYSMLDKEVTVISPNADKNVFTGKVVIKPGSVGYENLADAPDMTEINREIQNAKDDAASASQAASEVQQSVADLTGYVDGAFSDGIISESEAKAIATYINVVDNEKKSAEAVYDELYNNPYLEGSAKVGLANAKSAMFSAADALTSSVNTAIADGKATQGEKADVDAKYASFNTACASFNEAVKAAEKSIQDKLKGYADNAQMAADEANQAASNAQEDANEARQSVDSLNDYVDGAFKDGIITEAEAKAIATYINTVNNAKKGMDATYSALYANTYLTGTYKSLLFVAKNSFDTAVTNLTNAINSAIADGKTTESEKSTVDTRFTSFNDAYASLSTAIGNANKAIQDKIKQEAADQAKEDIDAQIGEVDISVKNEIAKQLGYTDYENLKYYAERGMSIIKGGTINTELLEAAMVITSQLIANAIMANTLNVNNKFKVYTDGSVDMSGIFRSLGSKTELVISNGYMRIMYNGSDVMLISVDESSGAPTINMNYNNKRFFISPDQFTFRMSDGRMLTFDPETINRSGQVMANPEGFLYVASQQYNYITAWINISPSNGGSALPFVGTAMKLEGSTDTLEAIPADGYEFDRWSDGGSQTHDITWSGSSYSYTAYFKKIQTAKYTVTLKVSPSGSGTVSGGGTYDSGTRRTVSATANSGYRFVRWSDGGSQSHTVTWDANKTLTAYFERYTVTGNEIFQGTALTSSSYWQAYGGASIVSVSGGVATLRFNDTEAPTEVVFNKGYLGSKIEQGHKYKLTITAKASKGGVNIIGALGYNSLWGSFGEREEITAFVIENISYSGYTTYEVELTAVYGDSTSSTGLEFFCSSTPCTLTITKISLVEV
jgi:hypothetical protein